jgi:hypothetical protein
MIRYGIGLALLAFAASANLALAQSGSDGGSIAVRGWLNPQRPRGEASPMHTSRDDQPRDEAVATVAAISTARGWSFRSARPVPAAARRR